MCTRPLDSFLADVADILRGKWPSWSVWVPPIFNSTQHYPLPIDPKTRAFYESRGWTVDRWLSADIELDNVVIGDFTSQAGGLRKEELTSTA